MIKTVLFSQFFSFHDHHQTGDIKRKRLVLTMPWKVQDPKTELRVILTKGGSYTSSLPSHEHATHWGNLARLDFLSGDILPRNPFLLVLHSRNPTRFPVPGSRQCLSRKLTFPHLEVTSHHAPQSLQGPPMSTCLSSSS